MSERDDSCSWFLPLGHGSRTFLFFRHVFFLYYLIRFLSVVAETYQHNSHLQFLNQKGLC